MITSHGYETQEVCNSGSHHLQTISNLHWRREVILAAAMLALFLSVIDSTAGETRIPGSSFPPDASPNYRPAIPQDLTVPRQPRIPGSSFPPDASPNYRPAISQDLTVPRQPRIPGSSFPPDASPNYRPAISQDLTVPRQQPHVVPEVIIHGIVDVNNENFLDDGKEPNIALNPEHPELVVIHGGFGQWGGFGSSNAPLYVSIDGGATWDRPHPINPPPGGADAGCPCDTTIYYGANSQLFGSFLGALNNNTFIYTGSTDKPFRNSPSFQWTLTGGVVQNTEQINTQHADQPWVIVHPSSITGQPLHVQSDVYVAYSDFAASPVATRVAVGSGNPPIFTIDNQDGSRTSGPKVFINPGHRLAVADRTVFPDGSVVNGWIYSLYQTCNDCSSDLPLISYMLNRTQDGGATWSLNGSSSGIEVAAAHSEQGEGSTVFIPKLKFGGVNTLLGGIDALAVNPTDGVVYVVYGTNADGFNGLEARRLVYTSDPIRLLVPGQPSPVSLRGVQAALPSVAVTANGMVGVLYDTFDGNDASGFPAFSAHLAVADGHEDPMNFTDYTLLRFLSPALPDNNAFDPQRVWGDYQQMIAFGNKFYGVFAGNGAALGKSVASTDPIFFTADVCTQACGYLTVFKILEHPDANHLRLFNLQIDGVTVRANVNGGSTGPQVVSPGNHTVGETGGTDTTLPIFFTVIGGDCAADGTVNVAPGENKACTITNYDNAGGCHFSGVPPKRSICCEPGDGTQECKKCSLPGEECP
jgi:hypothetical protein